MHSIFDSCIEKLTDPAFEMQSPAELGFLRRSDSNTSLNSLMGFEGDPHIRTCKQCRKLLERRDQQVQQRNSKSTVVLYYEVSHVTEY